MTIFSILFGLSFALAVSHGNNWAVLVSTSRDWRNYRHGVNALSIYRDIKGLGIPDRNIILMLADDFACNARNTYPGMVFGDRRHSKDLYSDDIEVDYRGLDVTVDNFIRVLTGCHDDFTPLSKRMMSDSSSNILIYLTGHGGDQFLRFLGTEDLLSNDVADAFVQMHEKRRYKEVLLVVDTCQASTLYSKIRSPNIFCVSSSIKGENSYSFENDPLIGSSLIDRFTLATTNFLRRVTKQSNETLGDLIRSYNSKQLMSTMHFDGRTFQRHMDSVPLTDFFGHQPKSRIIAKVHLVKANSKACFQQSESNWRGLLPMRPDLQSAKSTVLGKVTMSSLLSMISRLFSSNES